MLGTIGCSPAFDRFFKKGISNKLKIKGNLNKTSITKMIEFYKENELILEKYRKDISNCTKVNYTKMKMIDMIFWQIGKNKN